MTGRPATSVPARPCLPLASRTGRLTLVPRPVFRWSSYRRTRQNVALAFVFNGVGIPLAATGLIQPVWAMISMALSVTTIFVNSLGGRPSLLFQASVGRTTPFTSEL